MDESTIGALFQILKSRPIIHSETRGDPDWTIGSLSVLYVATEAVHKKY